MLSRHYYYPGTSETTLVCTKLLVLALHKKTHYNWIIATQHRSYLYEEESMCVCVHTCICVRVCVCACVRMCELARVHACAYVRRFCRVHMRVRRCMHMNTYARVCVCVCTCVCEYAFMLVHCILNMSRNPHHYTSRYGLHKDIGHGYCITMLLRKIQCRMWSVNYDYIKKYYIHL